MNITISVFFSGTGHKINDSQTLASLLKDHIDTAANDQIAIGFDGCGCATTYGVMGAIFGTGLDEQCSEVITTIETQIKKGNTITLNVYGHSRGAVAALMLAKQLGTVDPSLLGINLALMDPVPGNFITTSTLDLFEVSLAKKNMDLRSNKALKSVLALYPHEPLGTLAVHAPLFALYPSHTVVEEEVIAGCHAGAQFQSRSENEINFREASLITFARIFSFLRDHGTHFKAFPPLTVDDSFDPMSWRHIKRNVDINKLDEDLVFAYQKENARGHEATYRDCHSASGRSINTRANAEFFNLHHQRLLGQAEDKRKVRVLIEENRGLISQIKRATLNYPKTWQVLKWTVLSLGLASLIFFTGGLGAIPIGAALTAHLGVLSIIVLAPVVGSILATLWYGALNPLSKWAINRFFYPKFQTRDINFQTEPVLDNPRRLSATRSSNTDSLTDSMVNSGFEPLFKTTSQQIYGTIPLEKPAFSDIPCPKK